MPCPFTGPKMFCAGPNFLSQPKNLFTFCARQKDDLHSAKLFFVPAQNILGFVKGQGINDSTLNKSPIPQTGRELERIINFILCLQSYLIFTNFQSI